MDDDDDDDDDDHDHDHDDDHDDDRDDDHDDDDNKSILSTLTAFALDTIKNDNFLKNTHQS